MPSILSRIADVFGRGREQRLHARMGVLEHGLTQRLEALQASTETVESRSRRDADNLAALHDEIARLTERLSGFEASARANQAGVVEELRDEIAALGRRIEDGAARIAALDARIKALPAALTLEMGSAAGAWMHDCVSARRFMLFQDREGRVLANPRTSAKPPAAVISVPKAGTYLMGLLLERLGYVDSEVHLSQTFLTDYRGLAVEDKRRQSHDGRTIHLPVVTAAALVGDGQFAVGHLHSEPQAHLALAGFRKIFIYRELVDATLSHLRFLVDSGRAAAGATWADMEPSPAQALAFLDHHGAELVDGSYRPVIDWLDQPNVFAIAYEDLAGDRGDEHRRERLTALAAFLEVSDLDLADLLTSQVIGQPTKTLSSGRTQAKAYLDDAVRQKFRDLGVDALNIRLGYAPL